MAISLFLDDRLDPRAQARLNKHLEHCADCSSYLDDLRDGLSELRSMPLAEPSTNFEWNLRRKLQEALSERRLLARQVRPRAFWPRFTVSTAATLLLCVGAASLWLSSLDRGALTRPAERPLVAADTSAEHGETPQRLAEEVGGTSPGFQPVGVSEQRFRSSHHPEAIRPADPSVKYPLEQNAVPDSESDSLRAEKDTTP